MLYLVNIGCLWTLCLFKVAQLARAEANLGLLCIEGVISIMESVFQVSNVACRVECFPWHDAGLPLAGFSNHHKRVQSVDDLSEGSATDLVLVCTNWVFKKIFDLIRIALQIEKTGFG